MRVSPLNLLTDAWIPVVTAGGRQLAISPADLTRDIGSADPVVDVVWPRPDFRLAQIEFLVGLLATACPPRTGRIFRQWWNEPPSPDRLAEVFAPFAIAFAFDGVGACFLQDLDVLGPDRTPAGALLIEQPGANTERNNTDLFVKRARVPVLGRSTAAIALQTLQAFAPSGGAGHRTSLRGGGPLVTLAVPRAPRTLWHLLWLNTLAVHGANDGDPLDRLPDVFPWLAPTRTSEDKRPPTTLIDIHQAQVFWGMPRRIRLDFEPNEHGEPCAVTGAVEPVVVRTYRTRPYGVNYAAIRHPLTPTYRVKAGVGDWLPVHPKPGSLAYRHWPSYAVIGDENTSTRQPAPAILEAKTRLMDLDLQEPALIRLAGYDMDNMKAVGFVEAEQPLFAVKDAGLREALDLFALDLVAAAGAVVSALAGAVKDALGQEDGVDLDNVRASFWRDTEPAFFAQLGAAGRDLPAAGERADVRPLRERWLTEELRPQALAAFDAAVPTTALVATADVTVIGRAANARRGLGYALHGYGKLGRALFEALQLRPPETAKAAKGGQK